MIKKRKENVSSKLKKKEEKTRTRKLENWNIVKKIKTNNKIKINIIKIIKEMQI